jgi:c-di-GMP-related signal transduction protein
MMDVILNLPLPKVLNQVEFSPVAKAALLGEGNRIKKHLDLVISYCSGDWTGFQERCLALHHSPEHAASAYLEAVRWVNNVVALA